MHITYFSRNLRTSRGKNWRILGIKKAKFAGYCFYMNTKTQEGSQIYISIPLKICSTSITLELFQQLIMVTWVSFLTITLSGNSKWIWSSGASFRISFCLTRAQFLRFVRVLENIRATAILDFLLAWSSINLLIFLI